MQNTQETTSYWKPVLVLAGAVGAVLIARTAHAKMQIALPSTPRDWVVGLRSQLLGRIKEMPTVEAGSLGWAEVAVGHDQTILSHHFAIEFQSLGKSSWNQEQWLQLFKTGKVGGVELSPSQLANIQEKIALLEGVPHISFNKNYTSLLADLCTQKREVLVGNLSEALTLWGAEVAALDWTDLSQYALFRSALGPLKQINVTQHTSFTDLERLAGPLCLNRQHWVMNGGLGSIMQLPPATQLQRLEAKGALQRMFRAELAAEMEEVALNWQSSTWLPGCEGWSGERWVGELSRHPFVDSHLFNLMEQSGHTLESMGALCKKHAEHIGRSWPDFVESLYRAVNFQLVELSDGAFVHLIRQNL